MLLTAARRLALGLQGFAAKRAVSIGLTAWTRRDGVEEKKMANTVKGREVTITLTLPVEGKPSSTGKSLVYLTFSEKITVDGEVYRVIGNVIKPVK